MAVREEDAFHTVVDSEHCDLQTAQYDAQLSSAGRDDVQHLVYTTVDRVAFRPTPEIVERILEANGFALNLENMLACVDEVRIGYRVRTTPHAQPPHAQIVAKSFLPALTTRLPAKNRVGPLLAKFYAEVDAYRAELAQLQEERGRARGHQRKEFEEIKRERDQLKEQNDMLQNQLSMVARELSDLRKAHADATKALADQNVLPAQVRMAQVHEVDLETRHVALKSGRKVFSIPLVALWIFPEKEDRCLVSLQDGEVAGVFFHEGRQSPPGMVLGEVLHVVDDTCKIREESRRTRIISAKNPAERQLIQQMRRGDRILLFLHDDELIRFTPCGPLDAEAFVRAVQESIARWEIAKREGQETHEPGPS